MFDIPILITAYLFLDWNKEYLLKHQIKEHTCKFKIIKTT